MNLLHLNSHFQSLGGVEAVLKTHRRLDRTLGLNSRFVITHERPSADFPDVDFLGLSPDSNLRTARNRFRKIVRAMPESCVVYHDNWILPWLADLDRASRRILLLHSDYPDLSRHLQDRLPFYDGVLTVSIDLLEMVKAAGVPADRVDFVNYPISPPQNLNFPERVPGDRLRIGYCGRIEVNQKRVDRIPELIDQLRQRDIPFQLELLGAGPDEDVLKKRLHGAREVRFLGRRTGDEYWNTLAQWDCIVFFSDFEGTPIALLEAMTAGAIPVFPRIQSGGDRLIASVSPELLYDCGRLDQAAAILETIRERPAENLDLREKGRLAIEPFREHHYLQQFSDFARRLCSMPSHSRSPEPPCTFPFDLVPFRALGWRNRLRRLIQIRRQK